MPRWEGIVVHHSESSATPGLDTRSIRDWHIGNNGWDDIGYHFLVEKVGTTCEVIAGRPLNMNGAHARGSNRTHIGVCLVGDFNRCAPPAAQLRVAARHIKGLMSAFTIAKSTVKFHRDVNDTGCPGTRFKDSMLLGLL